MQVCWVRTELDAQLSCLANFIDVTTLGVDFTIQATRDKVSDARRFTTAADVIHAQVELWSWFAPRTIQLAQDTIPAEMITSDVRSLIQKQFRK